MKRIIKAPTGSELTCKNWLIEAAYRMLQNNLDPDVAFDPDNLIVYGGRGQPTTFGYGTLIPQSLCGNKSLLISPEAEPVWSMLSLRH